MATHIIEIEAKINNGWSEKELRNYCMEKLDSIDSIWDPQLESLEISKKIVKAKVLIHSTFYDFKKYDKIERGRIKSWINSHITESGIRISKININFL